MLVRMFPVCGSWIQKAAVLFIEVNSKGQNRIIVSAGTNRMYTEEYIKNVLEKAEAGDFVLLQNEINMVGEIIRLRS